MQSFHLPPLAWFAGVLLGCRVAPASGLAPQQLTAAHRASAQLDEQSLRSAVDAADAFRRLQTVGLTSGFDAARAQYAAGVQSGLIERSLLASAAFERKLGLLEQWLLGPWARSV